MRDFATLFTGRDDVFGTYSVPAGTKPSAKGKLAGTAATKRGPVTEASYAAHLDGKKRLGIVPIRLDNTVMWIAIDADVYKDASLYEQLARKIAKLGLPLVITKSKSGGAHLWCFFRDPVPASTARTIAADYVKKLKLDPKTEIFPKQEMILESDDGSWINLPYFGGTCVGLDELGKRELTLTEFLEHADDHTIAPGDLKKQQKQSDDLAQDDEHAEAPPCVAKMLKDGVEEGGRDNALAQMAIYFARAFPDEIEERIASAAKEVMHPPMNLDDIAKITRSVKKKEYQYLCKQQPMCTLCDKPACLKKKFGVGSGESAVSLVQIDGVKKLDGEEPIYKVSMYGREITCDAETFMNFSAFRVEAFKKLNRVLPTMKQPMWDEIVQEQMALLEITAPAPDTQMGDRIIKQFKDWCEQYSSDTSPEVIIESKVPFWDGKSMFFIGDDFLGQIDRQFRIARQDAWRYLSDWGVVQDKLTIKDKKVLVWRYQPDDGLWFDIQQRGII